MINRLPLHWCLLLLALPIVLAYSTTFHVPFILDDLVNIVNNPTITSLSHWQALFYPPYLIINRPILNVSLALSYAISGQEPWGYHLFNLTIHILATWTLFGIVRRTLMAFPASRIPLPPTSFALVVAAWWGLHPIQTQSVTYTIQRCESMAGLLVMLTLYAALRGWQEEHHRRPWFFLAVLATLVGTGVKETIFISLPLVLFYDRFYRQHTFVQAIRQSFWLYLGLLLAIIFLAANIHRTGLASQLSIQQNMASTPWGYALIQTDVILHYVGLLLWPDKLTMDYHWPLPPTATLVWTTLLVSTALAWSVVLYHRRHPLGYPLMWWWLALAPSSSFFPLRDPVFEQRLYLPTAGLVILVLAVLVHLNYKNYFSLIPFWLKSGLLVGMALLLATTTLVRNHDYRSREAIYRDNIAKSPGHYRPRLNLALELQDQGRHQEALEVAQQAWDLNVDNIGSATVLGISLLALERYQDALYVFQADHIRSPTYLWTLYYLGITSMKLGHQEEALDYFAKALALNPNLDRADMAHEYSGDILMEKGEIPLAIEHYRISQAMQPGQQKIQNKLNQALALQR